MSLGKNIKILRKYNKITLDELSKKTKIGKSTLSEIENGNTKHPSIFTIKKIAEVFCVSIDFLLIDYPENCLTPSLEFEEFKILCQLESFKNLDPFIRKKLMEISKVLISVKTGDL